VLAQHVGNLVWNKSTSETNEPTDALPSIRRVSIPVKLRELFHLVQDWSFVQEWLV
jgi:hypothetical protein